MKTFILALSFMLVPALTFARPADLKKYKDAYPDKAASANCNLCHGAKKTDLNDFGKAYLAADKDFSKMPKMTEKLGKKPGKKVSKMKAKHHHKKS